MGNPLGSSLIFALYKLIVIFWRGDMLDNTYSKIKAIKIYLRANTNKFNPISLKVLSNNLDKIYNLKLERKTLQKYLNILIGEEDCVEIVGSSANTAYYYKRSKCDFSLMEEKIIYDSISNIACLPEDLINNLKCKVIKNTYKEDKKLIETSLDIKYCTTCNDEETLKNIFGVVFETINNKHQLIFDYMRLTGNKEWIAKLHNKVVCPISIVYNNGKYYLHAYLPDEDYCYNFRIDRMLNVKEIEVPMVSIPSKYSFDLTHFKQYNFNMYAGEKKRLVLQFYEELTNQICDKFGKHCEFERDKTEQDKCILNIEVEVGNTFYSWLSNYKGKIKILSPEEEAANYIKFLKDNLNSYLNHKKISIPKNG